MSSVHVCGKSAKIHLGGSKVKNTGYRNYLCKEVEENENCFCMSMHF